MDALSALGLAAAIIQFVDFGTRVVERLADFSAALDQVPRAFRQVKTELPLIIDGLRRVKQQAESGKVTQETQDALLPVVQECQREAERLSDVLDKALPAVGASSWERRKKAIISLAKDKKVQEIAEALGGYIRTLTFHQVIEARCQPGATELQEQQVFWLVPFDRNASFVGRDEIFAQIHETFEVREDSQPKAALHGLGGIGKSQIALEYCYRRRESDPDCSVFWVNAASASRFEESYQRIARETGLSAGNGQSDGDLAAVRDWLEVRYQHRWLMVVDNVDDEAVFFRDLMPAGKTPSQCIPCCPRGSILYTTRTRDMAFDLANPASPISVPVLNGVDGLQLVRKRLQGEYTDDVILDFLADLEYIPLAITQALACIAKRRKSIPWYLQQYRSGDTARAKLLSYEFSDHGRQGNTMESVARTWNISFDWIRQSNPDAANLLILMSFFQHHGIPRQLLRGQEEHDEEQFEEAMDVLTAFSFVEADEEREAYYTHRLVQLATRWWVDNGSHSEADTRTLMAQNSLLHAFRTTILNRPNAGYLVFESLWPHAESVLRHRARANINEQQVELGRADVLQAMCDVATGTGFFFEKVKILREILCIRKKHLGQGHPSTRQTMSHLVGSIPHDSAGERQEAVSLGWCLLKICYGELGSDNSETLWAVQALAVRLTLAGQPELAEFLLRRSLARSQRLFGPASTQATACICQLGYTLRSQDRYEEADQIFMEAATNGSTIKHRILRAFGVSFMGGGDAEGVLEECSDLQDITQGSVRLLAASCYALCLRRVGRRREATEKLRECLAAIEQTYDPVHPITLDSTIVIAQLLAEQARFIEAIDACERAIGEVYRSRWRNTPAYQDRIREIEEVKDDCRREIKRRTRSLDRRQW